MDSMSSRQNQPDKPTYRSNVISAEFFKARIGTVYERSGDLRFYAALTCWRLAHEIEDALARGDWPTFDKLHDRYELLAGAL